MKKRFFFLLSMGMLMASCMNLTEKIYINSNGTGSYQLDLDMAPLIDMMKSMDENQGDSIQDVYTEMAKEESEYANLPGISNTKNHFDRDKNVYSTTFDFSNRAALQSAWNKGSSVVNNMGELNPTKSFKSLTGSKKKYALKLDLTELRKSFADSEEEDMEMTKMMLEDYNYSIELHFDRPVASFKGINLSRGEDKNTVIFTIPLVDMFFDATKDEINLSVKLK